MALLSHLEWNIYQYRSYTGPQGEQGIMVCVEQTCLWNGRWEVCQWYQTKHLKVYIFLSMPFPRFSWLDNSWNPTDENIFAFIYSCTLYIVRPDSEWHDFWCQYRVYVRRFRFKMLFITRYFISTRRTPHFLKTWEQLSGCGSNFETLN